MNMIPSNLAEMVERVKPRGKDQLVLHVNTDDELPTLTYSWRNKYFRFKCEEHDAANAVLAELVGRMKPGCSVACAGPGEFAFEHAPGERYIGTYSTVLEVVYAAFVKWPNLFKEPA